MVALGSAWSRTFAAVAGTTDTVAGIGRARIVPARIRGPIWWFWFVASTRLPLAPLEALLPAAPIHAAATRLALAATSLAHAATAATGRKFGRIISAAFAFTLALAAALVAASFRVEDIVFVLSLGRVETDAELADHGDVGAGGVL